MNWKDFIIEEQSKSYYKSIIKHIDEDSSKYNIYPAKENIFNAFKLTPLDKTKVVIVGMDPYHGPNQAHGLSFSVLPGIDKPPSLANIFKELKSDLNIDGHEDGDLTSWAKQGVLLLNAALTVRESQPGSHQEIGWQIFTDAAIELINKKDSPVVFVLWGAFAKSKKKLITNTKHLILESAHPSPLSSYRGFFGSKPFSKINKFLIDNGNEPISW
jgi:uracil-DNA glycosylase